MPNNTKIFQAQDFDDQIWCKYAREDFILGLTSSTAPSHLEQISDKLEQYNNHLLSSTANQHHMYDIFLSPNTKHSIICYRSEIKIPRDKRCNWIVNINTISNPRIEYQIPDPKYQEEHTKYQPTKQQKTDRHLIWWCLLGTFVWFPLIWIWV